MRVGICGSLCSGTRRQLNGERRADGTRVGGVRRHDRRDDSFPTLGPAHNAGPLLPYTRSRLRGLHLVERAFPSVLLLLPLLLQKPWQLGELLGGVAGENQEMGDSF